MKSTKTDKESAGKALATANMTVFRRMRLSLGAMLHGAEEASDIFQDAFLRLWGSEAQDMTTEAAAKLTATTARRMAIDQWRRDNRRVSVTLDNELHDTAADNTTGSSNETRLRYEAIRRIIDSKLTPQQREVMTLRDINGWDFADIAAELGVDETTVRMRLSRARKAVREAYEQEQDKMRL